MKRRILTGLLLLFVGVQFFQPSKNLGSLETSNDIHQAVPILPAISAILKQSCYDCHSNRTEYPWYANLTPINWWISDHISEGKAELNFSIFRSYSVRRQKNLLEGIAETVKSDKMPLSSYIGMHANAELSPTAKLEIFNWANSAKIKLSASK